MDQGAVIIVLLGDEGGVIDVIHPVGDLFVVLALPGDGVDHDSPVDVGAAE